MYFISPFFVCHFELPNVTETHAPSMRSETTTVFFGPVRQKSITKMLCVAHVKQ